MTITLAEKYEQERKKRQDVSQGLSQYLNKEKSSSFVISDPWIESGTPVRRPVSDGGHVKVVVFGAGFAGVLSAIKCLEEGAVLSPSEVLIVDPAGGFGGTCYWNRYPGQMCDVESYTYLPLLEETGFVPTRRFPGGEEIRKYFDIMAKHYHLDDRAMFQSAGKSLTWEDDHWACEILEHPKGLPQQTVRITADFVILGSGGFTYPKLPNTPGLDKFQGKMMHTGRFDYSITGGSPADPTMKRTGATAIQCVPEVAKFAKELYVFQRTPSAVDARGNRDTDPEEWQNKIASKHGWQAERSEKLQVFTEQSHDLPEGVAGSEDGFYSTPSIKGAFGGPSDLGPDQVAEHIARLQAMDDARADRVRQRTKEIVNDPETAEKLQAWYPTWCKRPTYHDEYLPAFNRPNVHLVDTDGKGLDTLTETGIQVAGKKYPIDVIIWSTGYGNPLTESLAGKAEMAVRGRDGQDMEQLNQQMSLKTLYGCIAHNFPNLFLTALSQAGVGVNQVQRLEAQGAHNGYIIAEAQRRAAFQDPGTKVVAEPTEAACDAWGDELASAAHLTAGILACTPGYFTLEGDVKNLTQEQLENMGRGGLYGQGYLMYARTLEKWRAQGGMEGIEVR